MTDRMTVSEARKTLRDAGLNTWKQWYKWEERLCVGRKGQASADIQLCVTAGTVSRASVNELVERAKK